MKAIDISGQSPGGARVKLADRLPLDTPFVVQFFPIYACNFRCRYCTFSIPAGERGFISDKAVMDFELFKKCVDELRCFPSKIKTLRFVGMGEPLLHPKIAEMVKYAAEQEVANRVEILSNASLLTPKMSDSLIEAGLSRLVISLQGTSAEKYRDISNIELNFNEFVSNLKYFYEHKTDIQMHIKVIDIALDGKDDEKRFFEIFGDLCDTIGIEHAGPIYPGVAINDDLDKASADVTQFGLHVAKEEKYICPQPFFTMQINPDGNVVPCYSISYPDIIGNCNTESLNDIWNGKKLQRFRLEMLEKAQSANSVCAECKINIHRRQPEDSLNEDLDRLRRIYGV